MVDLVVVQDCPYRLHRLRPSFTQAADAVIDHSAPSKFFSKDNIENYKNDDIVGKEYIVNQCNTACVLKKDTPQKKRPRHFREIYT